jgi:O-antigen ligase
MVLGGGGTPNPGTEILLELVAVVAALAWLWLPGENGRLRVPQARTPWVIAALVLLVPVVQLVPLPPGVWQALPGQADKAAALALVGADVRWQPLSLSPMRTLASLLALGPPLAIMLATAALASRGRALLVAAIALVALTAALLGGVQVPLGGMGPHLYAETNPGATGFQANKNAAADVLLIGMVAVAVTLGPAVTGNAVARPLIANRRAAWLAIAGVLLVMLLATVLTNSRAGIALIPLALLGVWAVLAPGKELKGSRAVPALVLALLVAFLALAAVLAGNTSVGAIFARFAAVDDFRRQLWRDGWFALTRSWPSGIGVGGAASALIAAERLEILDPSVPNRVHNDYLEFALEGGILAVAVMLTLAAVLGAAAWRSWRERPEDRPQTVFGIAILMIVGLHSLVDYPLRSMALACLAGVGAGLLTAPSRRDAVARRGEAATGIRGVSLES